MIQRTKIEIFFPEFTEYIDRHRHRHRHPPNESLHSLARPRQDRRIYDG